MSGNSWTSALQTAPIVTALGAGRASCGPTSSSPSAPGSASASASAPMTSVWAVSVEGIRPRPLRCEGVPSTVDDAGERSPGQERELVFADLQLVAVDEPV